MATDFNLLIQQSRSGEEAPTAGVVDFPSIIEARRRDASEREATLRGSSLVQTGIEPGPLGPPGFPDLGARFDIGLSDTFDEKRAKFKERFPEGDFLNVQIPSGGSEVLFRKNRDEPFAKFDAGFLEAFEPLGDIADIAADLPSAVVEAFIVRGGRIVKQLARVFAGEVVGRAGKEVVEELRGYQKETAQEMSSRILTESIIGTAGAGLTTAISGPLNFISGRANIAVVPGAPAAQKAASDLGVPALLPSQISQSPLLKKLGGQASGTTGTIKSYVQEQQRSIVSALSGLRDRDRENLIRGNLIELHENARRQVIEGARLSDKTLSDGGKAIQQGIAEYSDLSSAIVSKAYQDARKIGTPEFDANPALQIAADIEARAQALGRPLPADVQNVIGRLRSFDPNEPPTTLPSGAVIDATERLRALQQDLWDLKNLPVGVLGTPEQREAARQAASLSGAISHVLRNPRNAEAGFAEAWSNANTLAARRFDTLEKALIIRAQRDETPAMLASRLAQPLQTDNLVLLKEVLPANRWDDFTKAARADFIDPRNVDNLTSRMNSFDRPTLDTLFTKAEQQGLRDVGRQIDRLNRVGLERLTADQTRATAVIDQLIAGRNTAGISQLLELAPLNSDARKTIRAGLMERLVRNATKSQEGSAVIDGPALRKGLAELRETGAIRFLNLNDVQTLRNADRYVEFVPLRPDVGGSMQTGEVAAGVLQLRLSSLGTYLHNATLGRLLTSKTFQRAVTGAGKKPIDWSNLRIMGSVLADAATDVGQ